uniref:Uncharacterized protein n=1 Tax=viral metagenome TaxID=1070528 RepID=A0A6M3M297_9ZZZZ
MDASKGICGDDVENYTYINGMYVCDDCFHIAEAEEIERKDEERYEKDMRR